MKPADLTRRCINLLADRSRRSRIQWSFAAAIVIGLLAGMTTRYGASHIKAPWDVFILLDGGWRMLNGQVPHTDFYNPIGPITYLLVWAGMKLSKPSLSAVAYGSVIFMLLTAVWAWSVARGRLSGFLIFLLLVFVAFLSVSPRPLGFEVTTTSYAMLYNRFGYVLLLILFVQVFLPDEHENSGRLDFNGLSIGALLAVLFFCKITFFVFGVGAVALAILFRTVPARSIVAQAFAFIGFGIGMWLVFSISPIDYVADILAAGRGQSPARRLGMFETGLNANLVQLYLSALILIPVIATPSLAIARPRALSRWKVVLAFGYIIASAILITGGNSLEGTDIPLFFAAGLVLLHFLSECRTSSPSETLTPVEVNYLLALAVVIPVFLGGPLLRDAATVAYYAYWHETKMASVPESQRFDSETLADFVIPKTSDWQTAYWRAHEVPERINDGLRLLRGHVGPQSRIFSMTMTNPFSFALQLPPPIGPPLWWDLGISVDRSLAPAPAAMLREVDTIIVPVLRDDDEGCCKDTVTTMMEFYGPYISEHFDEVDRSRSWVVYPRTR